MIKTRMTGIVAALVIAAVASLSPMSASASTVSERPTVTTSVAALAPSIDETPFLSSTGRYEWVCQGTDGSAWSMPYGTPLKQCSGVSLQKYLDGRLLKTYKLAYTGGPTGSVIASGSCAAVVVGGFALVLFPPTGAAAWFATALVNAAPLAECLAT